MTDGAGAVTVAIVLIGLLAVAGAPGAVADRAPVRSEFGRHAIELPAAVGVVVLLFRIGLESTPDKLVRQLPTAGFALLIVPALFAAVALTEISVGISLAPWREAGAIDSDSGALLLDLAELDDLTGVLLLALLPALVPALLRGEHGSLRSGVAWLLVAPPGVPLLRRRFPPAASLPR